MNTDKYYAALDIGAGRGAKIAFFTTDGQIASESLLGVEDYCLEFSEFAATLAQRIKMPFLPMEKSSPWASLRRGILNSDGGFQLFANCARYNGHNIRKSMEKPLTCRSHRQRCQHRRPRRVVRTQNGTALWVFGGGWGGAWVSEDGQILHPAHDWDGRDSSLHYTNEPGYAIPLSKHKLRLLFLEVGASYELFEQYLTEDPDLPESVLQGPGGSADSLRAEVILSGPGRCRLFRALVGDDTFYERFLDIHELTQINDPSIAGKYISKLSSMRVESAINTDRLYGKILAEAAKIMLNNRGFRRPERRPSHLLRGQAQLCPPLFRTLLSEDPGKMGIMSYLRPSVLDEKNLNANLVGASVLAKRAYESS